MSGRGSTTWSEAGIPSELRALPRWVAWRYVERDGCATKVPICARTGRAASTTDPTTWSDYPTAARCARTHAEHGVGFVLGDGWVGVDLDDCVTGRGEFEPWARAIVTELDSYTETSPSGRGAHVHVRGTLPPGRNRKGHVEMYDHGRFFCVTGEHMQGTPHTIADRTAELAALHRGIFGSVTPTARPVSRLATPSASDSEIIERAHRARNGDRFGRLWSGDASNYSSQSEADLALCSLLAWYTDDGEQIARLVGQSGLAREKWGRADYRERTIAAAMASANGRRDLDAQRTAHTDALIARELGL